MELSITTQLLDLLEQAEKRSLISEEEVGTICAGHAIQWNRLKELRRDLSAARPGEDGDSIPSLQQLCTGSKLVVKPLRPSAPSTKTPEFLAHMEALRRRQEQRAYDAMVDDVLVTERAAEAARSRFSSYRGQLSVGLHVLVTMAALYAFGHVMGKTLLAGTARPELLGIALMTVGLLVESTLFIIRASTPPAAVRQAAARGLRRRMEEQVERQKRDMARDGKKND